MVALLASTGCTPGPREERQPAQGAATSSRNDSPTATRTAAPAIDALYVLDSVAGRPVPTVAFDSPRRAFRTEVLAESLWLRRDGSFTAWTAGRVTEDGRTRRWSAPDSGRYTLHEAVLGTDGLLRSGDVVLNSLVSGRVGFTSRLWARDGGRSLQGEGLPRAGYGTAALVPRTYRLVSPRDR